MGKRFEASERRRVTQERKSHAMKEKECNKGNEAR
jgi:hypothetical protein